MKRRITALALAAALGWAAAGCAAQKPAEEGAYRVYQLADAQSSAGSDAIAPVSLALDVAEDGNLICRIGGGLVKIAAGEASVRGMYGYV